MASPHGLIGHGSRPVDLAQIWGRPRGLAMAVGRPPPDLGKAAMAAFTSPVCQSQIYDGQIPSVTNWWR
ncbi:hypothetical protein NL676_005455 [Syzygium grande]|nr:hypothetical protein NL676_005455 [Syzygium grande]